MKKHIAIILLGVLIVGGLLTYTFAYQVDELKDIVIIETFGKVTRTLVGREEGSAGLHVKWPSPFEKVIRYDARGFVFEGTHTNLNTSDKQLVIVTAYCHWRISDAKRFHTAFRDDNPDKKVERVQAKLKEMLSKSVGETIAQYDLSVFINTDPTKMKLEKVEKSILEGTEGKEGFAAPAMRDYGVEIVRLGITRLDLPEEVTKEVINAMKEERQRDVKRYESGGKAEAEAIVARAQAARDQIMAFANRKAKNIKTEGDKAAAEYYKQFRTNPQFAIFLRSLESLKKELAEKSTIILDGSRVPAVRWILDGPSVGPAPRGTTAGSNN